MSNIKQAPHKLARLGRTRVIRLRPGPAKDRVAELHKVRKQIVRAWEAAKEALDEIDVAIDDALEEALKDAVS